MKDSISTVPVKADKQNKESPNSQSKTEAVTKPSQPLRQQLSSVGPEKLSSVRIRSTENTSDTATSFSSPPPPSTKKVIGPALPLSQKPVDEKQSSQQGQEDDNYASWLPPEGTLSVACVFACMSMLSE